MARKTVSWPVVASYVVIFVFAALLTGILLDPSRMITFGRIAPKGFELLVGALGTLAAAYIGARYAFLLQSNRELRKERDKKFNDALLVFISLTHALNRLYNIREKVKPFLRHRHRDYVIPAINPGDFKFAIDAASLSFLLDSKESEDFNFLSEVVIAGWGYQSVLDTVAERSKVWVDRLKPLAIEFHDANASLPGYPPAFLRSIPASVAAELNSLTGTMFEFMDREIARIESVANALGMRIKTAFPEYDMGLQVSLPTQHEEGNRERFSTPSWQYDKVEVIIAVSR